MDLNGIENKLSEIASYLNKPFQDSDVRVMHDELIQEISDSTTQSKKTAVWTKWMAIATFILAIVTISSLLFQYYQFMDNSPNLVVSFRPTFQDKLDGSKMLIDINNQKENAAIGIHYYFKVSFPDLGFEKYVGNSVSDIQILRGKENKELTFILYPEFLMIEDQLREMFNNSQYAKSKHPYRIPVNFKIFVDCDNCGNRDILYSNQELTLIYACNTELQCYVY
jgi:hypothetical protein